MKPPHVVLQDQLFSMIPIEPLEQKPDATTNQPSEQLPLEPPVEDAQEEDDDSHEKLRKDDQESSKRPPELQEEEHKADALRSLSSKNQEQGIKFYDAGSIRGSEH